MPGYGRETGESAAVPRWGIESMDDRDVFRFHIAQEGTYRIEMDDGPTGVGIWATWEDVVVGRYLSLGGSRGILRSTTTSRAPTTSGLAPRTKASATPAPTRYPWPRSMTGTPPQRSNQPQNSKQAHQPQNNRGPPLVRAPKSMPAAATGFPTAPASC